MAERRGEVVNKARLCVLTGRSRPLIDRWVIEGCPVVESPKDKGGEWKFNTAAVFDWLERQGADPDEAPDLNKERARLAKEQADSHALKNAVSRLELLPAEAVIGGWQSAIGRARSLILSVPLTTSSEIVLAVRSAPNDGDAETAVRAIQVRELDNALSELSNTALDDENEPPDEGGAGSGDEPMGTAA